MARTARLLCIVVVLTLSGAMVPVAAAPVFSDGFESGDLSAWTGSANLVARSGGRSGAWSATPSATGSPAHAWRSFTVAPELWARTWIDLDSVSGTTWLVSFRRSNGGAILLVGVNRNHRLLAKNAITKTTVNSGLVVPTEGWHEVEVHIRTGASGRFDVSFDGLSVAALSRTSSFGSATVGRFGIGDSNAGHRYRASFDDVSIATDGGPVDLEPPTVPDGLAASLSGDGVELTWNPAIDDSGSVSYTVYRSAGGGSFQSIATSTQPSYGDRDVEPDTTYAWRVDAVDPSGNRSDASASVSITTGPDTTAATMGRWSEPFDLGVVGVHASVVHTGEVLAFFRTTDATRSAILWDPGTGATQDVSPPLAFEHNMFCSAQSIRPDGRVFVTGGTLWGAGNPNGTEQTAFFDPISRSWTIGPSMTSRRWYPTDVSLPDGDALVFSGRISDGVYATEVDRYDAGTNTFSTLPSSATLQMGTYPRMFLLPDGRLVRVGQERQTLFFDPDAATWSPGPPMVHGSRTRGSVVLLPGLDRILAVGGATTAGATASAEILDLDGASPSWQPTAPMHEGRRNFNLVLLPGGDVLTVGGNGGTELYDQPVRQAELFDTQTETWIEMATQQAPRAYHSTAVLLPDGRVLSSGQTQGTMQTTAEIFSPPYLFAGERPTITASPDGVAYGASFAVGTDAPSSIEEVALIRGSTVTHGVSFDQRYVRLPFTAGSSGLVVDAPSSGAEAPPGWYMLFLIDAEGVPSVASWVHLS